MKNLFSICLLAGAFAISLSVKAQDDSVRVRNANEEGGVKPYKEGGFKKENLFTGGGVTASFYSGGSVLGISPVLGYKVNDYFDAGVVLNYVYTGARDLYEFNDKVRQHVFGPGVFVRGYPVSFLFLQAQFEQNFTNYNYRAKSNSNIYKDFTVNRNAPSLLLGGGYSTGRVKGGTTFFYVSILADVLKQEFSPYVDNDYDVNGNLIRSRIVPIIRAGVNVGLFQNRYGRY